MFDCDDVGELKEYVGSKVTRDLEGRWIRLTQPVLMQSFQDEFDLPTDGAEPSTPAATGEVLRKVGEGDEQLSPKEQKVYRKGVGKLLFMQRWSRPEISHAVRESSRFMTVASKVHLKRMALMTWVMN